jgi:hypothetical protein
MPKRPKGVPDDAVYFPEDKEWGQGAIGLWKHPNGHWRYWAAKGYLISEADYKHGRLLSYRRYHPDGSLAEEGTLDKTGRVVEQTWILPPKGVKSPEDVPSMFHPPKGTARVVKIPRSIPVTARFYDADGNELDNRGRRVRKKK